MANLTLNYTIYRPNDSTTVDTTISLPFMNTIQQNKVELLTSTNFQGYTYTIDAPFPYDTNSTIQLLADYDSLTSQQILTSNYSSNNYKNGTIVVQTNQHSGNLSHETITPYPIYYSVSLSPNVTTQTLLYISVIRENNVQTVSERLQDNKEGLQTLKTHANQLLHDRFDMTTPNLLRFHSVPKGYHVKNDSHIIRIDNEYQTQTGRYATLIESTDATEPALNRNIKIALPKNAHIETIYPIILYRKKTNPYSTELLPIIEIGHEDVTNTFYTDQTFNLENYTNHLSAPIIVDQEEYIVDIRGLQYDLVNERWNIISSRPQVHPTQSQLVLKKDIHIQKDFIAKEQEMRLSYNGIRIQALSLYGSQIQFITAKTYSSTINNLDTNQKRIVPSRYYTFNRNSLLHNMSGYEYFEDLQESGDILRQSVNNVNLTALTHFDFHDTQNLSSTFYDGGNITHGQVSFGAQAYILNGHHFWNQETPFQWNEWTQTGDNNNLTIFSPYTNEPEIQTQTLTYVLNIRTSQTGSFDENITILNTSYSLPNTTTHVPSIFNCEFDIIDNTTTPSSGVDLTTVCINRNTGEQSSVVVLSNLTHDTWHRIGLEMLLTWNKQGNDWSIDNMFIRGASYVIPDNGSINNRSTTSLSKELPSNSDKYFEYNVTTSNTNLFNDIGTVDTQNLTVCSGVGNPSNNPLVHVPDNLTVYLDELEVYTTKPIFTNKVGELLANPYH